MVVSDVVFQAVDIVHVHAVAEFLYFVQQESARALSRTSYSASYAMEQSESRVLR